MHGSVAFGLRFFFLKRISDDQTYVVERPWFFSFPTKARSVPAKRCSRYSESWTLNQSSGELVVARKKYMTTRRVLGKVRCVLANTEWEGQCRSMKGHSNRTFQG